MTEMKKVAAVITRHSRMLHVAIEQVRAKYPQVEEKFESKDGPRWTIEVNGETIGGPCETQWDAWMEAFNGPDNTLGTVPQTGERAPVQAESVQPVSDGERPDGHRDVDADRDGGIESVHGEP